MFDAYWLSIALIPLYAAACLFLEGVTVARRERRGPMRTALARRSVAGLAATVSCGATLVLTGLEQYTAVYHVGVATLLCTLATLVFVRRYRDLEPVAGRRCVSRGDDRRRHWPSRHATPPRTPTAPPIASPS